MNKETLRYVDVNDVCYQQERRVKKNSPAEEEKAHTEWEDALHLGEFEAGRPSD